jgi:hypothetical protein
MIQFRLFFTILFLLASLIVIPLIAIVDRNVFIMAVDMVKDYLWAAGIAAVIFLVLLSSGVVSNLDSIKRSLIRNGYFQLAILQLFLFSAGLGYIWYFVQQPGQIVLRIQADTPREYIMLQVKYKSAESTLVDTVRAPGKLYKRPAGRYSIETIDPDIDYFQVDVVLEPAKSDTLVIPVTLNTKELAVQTDPAGADIWINGLQATKTPHTFDILAGDTITLELKMDGYHAYMDTVCMNNNMDLGTIPLKKLFTVWISSRYADVRYKIFDVDNQVVFSSTGSRNLQLAQGRYRIAYEIGEGQYETKNFSLSYNSTVLIP